VAEDLSFKGTLNNDSCEKSCDYLQRIFTEKPGACPKINNQSNYVSGSLSYRFIDRADFSAFMHNTLCHLDGDCPETSKCCSYGCSRQCVLPKGRDPRLLPVPGSISVQERKRKRSIIIRWVMQKLTREQNAANSNLYVVQWRWGLQPDSSSMTEWQTVTVRNKPYAILKHLLSPGRYYQFRVGAVSVYGSLGFSQASQPFKLSKVIVPSHTTQSELAGLFPNSVYIVEIHASVDSSEGELHGEKGITFIRTLNATASDTLKEPPIDETGFDLDVPMTSDDGGDAGDDNNVDILTPFFDGDLQTKVSWVNSRACSPEKKTFIVTAKRGECREYQLNQHSDTSIHRIRVSDCSTFIRGLTFDCDYSLEIAFAGDTTAIITSNFSTKSCDETPSHGSIPCLSQATPLSCIVHATVSCHWVRYRELNADTVIGYRTSLSSPMRDDSNITILPPQIREIHYEHLIPSTMYTLQVQAITNRGMGKAVTTNFVTLAKIPDENVIERFPGGEIIELPLEASSTRWLITSTVLPLVLTVFVLTG
ncbi:hypothetical protein Angca_008840, partial [Angiostrongylus cantonensis]